MKGNKDHEQRAINNFLKSRVSATNDGIPWDIWKKRAKATENIDYQCDFKDGECKRATNINGYQKLSRDSLFRCGCCCSNCYKEAGYLYRIEEKDLEVYIKNWTVKSGFYSKKTGCKFPRELRSKTCLTYNCRCYGLYAAIKNHLIRGVGISNEYLNKRRNSHA